MVDPDRPHMTIWRMRVACCITNVINTHLRICNTYCFSTTTMVTRTRLNVTCTVPKLFIYSICYRIVAGAVSRPAVGATECSIN